MNKGDIVERRHILGFKGILLNRRRGVNRNVLWFKHPAKEVPCIEEIYSKNLKLSLRRSSEV